MTEEEALAEARKMIDAGIPVFAAAPCPADCKIPGHARTEFHLPRAWEKIQPSHKQLERWQPGWALAVVGGSTVDFLDEDPRHGGDQSIKELKAAGHMPRVFGIQTTPSGGRHYVIHRLHERKAGGEDGLMPGLDYQGGDDLGQGRGFVYIAPTRKRSKAEETAGDVLPYEWVEPIDFEAIEEWQGRDDSGEMLRSRIIAKRARSERSESAREQMLELAAANKSIGEPGDSGLFPAREGEAREFTEASAWEYARGSLDALRAAKIGDIEGKANVAAVMLSHFVPEFLSAEAAYSTLLEALSHTAYDPDGPYAAWTADKFKPVLDGRRPPIDNWKARKLPDAPAALVEEKTEDAADALIAEMLSADQMQERPAPRYLIKGWLNLDSEAWTIGEPGSKKTFVVLDQAVHVVQGKPWRGFKVEQGPVVMIVAEGASGMSTRIKAYQKKYGRIGEGLYILPRPVQASDMKAWRVLALACKKLNAVMIVIDTQARVTVGLKENDATDMGVYVHAVSILRETTKACVHTIHHTGRNGGDARGSSAIDGAQGTELKVIKTGTFTGLLRTEKQKDMAEAPDLPLAFERVVVGVDEDGDEISSLVLIESNAFIEAAGQEEREPWEVYHGEAQVRLLKVLRDQGGSVGLTKAEARANLVERFYGGDTKRLARSTYSTAWTKTLEKVAADGSPVVVPMGGAKFALDPVAFAAANEESARKGTPLEKSE
jgi:hypothetical protein